MISDFSGVDRNQMFIDEMEHFLRVCRGHDKPRVGLEDAAASLRMALAAKKSMTDQTSIHMEMVT